MKRYSLTDTIDIDSQSAFNNFLSQNLTPSHDKRNTSPIFTVLLDGEEHQLEMTAIIPNQQITLKKSIVSHLFATITLHVSFRQLYSGKTNKL